MDQVGGVYFRHDDYASFWLRLLVDLIDAVTVGVLCSVAAVILPAFVPAKLIPFVCTAIFFCYFVLLKRTAGGTVGTAWAASAPSDWTGNAWAWSL